MAETPVSKLHTDVYIICLWRVLFSVTGFSG